MTVSECPKGIINIILPPVKTSSIAPMNNEMQNLRLSLMPPGFSSNTNSSNNEDRMGSLIPASLRETTLWVSIVLYFGWTLISRLR
ncbi:hypothetical protein M0804_012246 [Polistes exclamans]|nr:hypothetical protein M0804_012246 [Polistes exclamans]